MDYVKNEVVRKKEFKKDFFDEFVLVGDVGGTNCRLAVFGIKGKHFKYIFSLESYSKVVKRFSEIIGTTLEEAYDDYGIKLTKCVLAAAGPVHGGVCNITNLDWKIDCKKILANTMLKKLYLINDFQAIGYGIEPLERINPESFLILKEGKQIEKSVKSLLGAGTGLGTGFLIYDDKKSHYRAMPSEGGHQTFSPVNNEEYRLAESVKKKLKREQVQVEDILSGPGLVRIYEFLKKQKVRITPEEIAARYDKDKNARKTFEIFTRFYARVAKNFALVTLPYAGMYLAGGIIAKNIDRFDKHIFIDEFTKHQTHCNVLKDIPVQIITNYDISLYGAVNYLVNFLESSQ
jgi:glucokinase